MMPEGRVVSLISRCQIDVITTGSPFNSSWNLCGPGPATDTEVAETWSTTYRRRNMVIGLMGALLNVLTLVAILLHKDLTRFLRCALTSLVSTDLGLLASIFAASLLYLSSDDVTLGIARAIYIFCDCTALTLLVIALDRASALYLPLWYKDMSQHYVKIMLLVLTPWLLAVGFSVPSFQDDIEGLPRYPIVMLRDSGILMQAVLLLTCGIGVLLAYVAIGVRLTLRTRRFRVHPFFFNRSISGPLSLSEYQRCRRLTVHTTFLALWFSVVYISFSCYLLVIYVSRADTRAEFNSRRNIFFSSVIMVNRIINPFLFFWRLAELRLALDLIQKLFHRLQQLVHPRTHDTQQAMVFTIQRSMEQRAECNRDLATHLGEGEERGNNNNNNNVHPRVAAEEPMVSDRTSPSSVTPAMPDL
ncbi:hypothetical protein ACOMHN_001346 [Nucella lapillus]